MFPVKVLYQDFNSEEHAEVKQNMMVIIIKQTNKQKPQQLRSLFQLGNEKMSSFRSRFPSSSHPALSITRQREGSVQGHIFHPLLLFSFSDMYKLY